MKRPRAGRVAPFRSERNASRRSSTGPEVVLLEDAKAHPGGHCAAPAPYTELVHHVSDVNLDIERDKILTADGAVEYGLIDSILESLKGTPATI